jgi:transcriptional regulator of arginine metabolism
MSHANQLISALSLLLQQESARNHQDLCLALKNQGYIVTQSTVSRLLRKLGAVKGLNAQNESVYQLPTKLSPALTMATDFNQLVLSITHNEQLIVIHTTPGSANMIARVLDLNRAPCYILGTIAGDDTILVIPVSVMTLDKSLEEIKKFLT